MAEGLSAYTNKSTFTNLLSSVSSGTSAIQINNSTVKIETSTGKLTTVFNETIGAVDKTINISKYTTPTRLTLDAFTNIGNDIDRSLKGSFLLQTLHIKGTDILCSTFCFLVSMLSCEERNGIYKALLNANKAAQEANAVAGAANNILNSVGAVMASTDAIAQTAKGLFSGNSSANSANLAINAAATITAAPATIMNNVQLVSNIFKLGTKANLMLPNVATLNIWDMSSNVLHCLQAQAVQAADEVLSKLTQPMEDAINRITPQPCFGTMAVRLQQSIISEIERFKQWLLSQIGSLFNSSADFNVNFLNKVNLSVTALELMAFTACLTNITAHFFDIARNCGISPCSPAQTLGNNNLPNISNLANNINNIQAAQQSDPFYNISTLPRYTNGVFMPPSITGTNAEELAKKMSPNMSIKAGIPQVFVTPDEVLSVNTIPTKDIPVKIKELIEKGALDPNLDSNYTVYIQPDAINVVYRYDKKCGEK